MKRVCQLSLVAFALFATSLSFASPATKPPAKVIYGLDAAQDFQKPETGEFYIQLGSFKKKSNAQKVIDMARSKTSTPVTLTQKTGPYYVVKLGPLASAADVRSISEALSTYLPRLPAMPPVPVPKPLPVVAPVVIPEQDNWYIEAEAGFEAPIVDNTMTANNGFNTVLPAPYNVDTFSTNTRWGGALGVGFGYRWQPNTHWLPAYSVGIRYKHYYPTNIGGEVTEFSIPELTNYKYNWDVTADIVMVSTKLNILRVGHFLPFFTAGAGLAFNRTSNFYETPLIDFVPRTDPGFTNNPTCRFTYNFGVGVDWQVQPKFIVSLDYEFQNLGSLYSGNGSGFFANGSLYSKTYQSNNILLSLTYLIGNQNNAS